LKWFIQRRPPNADALIFTYFRNILAGCWTRLVIAVKAAIQHKTAPAKVEQSEIRRAESPPMAGRGGFHNFNF